MTKVEELARSEQLGRLNNEWSARLIEVITVNRLEKIGSSHPKAETLFNSGLNPDNSKDGLKRVLFADYGPADDLFAFINKKWGCCLSIEFEKEARTVNEKGVIIMQYNGKRQCLTIQDAYRVIGRGMEDDRRKELNEGQRYIVVNNWFKSWLDK